MIKKNNLNELKIFIKNIINEEIDVDNLLDGLQDSWDNIPQGHKEQMIRDSEGNNISFSELVTLAVWLQVNAEIKNATQIHDEIESKKIPRLQETSLDIFKHTIFNNLKLIDNEIHGLHNTSKLLSKIFDIDPHLSEIELGKLIKNKLKYKIKS